MGWLRRDGLEPVESATAPEPARAPAGTLRRRGVRALRHPHARQHSPRKMKCLPVRFGAARPSTLAQTVNVSSEGMCVATPSPLDPGEPVRMHFDILGHTVTLHGYVVWRRARHEFGRPMGMGLRLVEAPEIYTNFVASLP
jgi:hypothetical protein